MERLRLGHLVEPINGAVLACGSGLYARAVVVSVYPFILVSEEADMRWSATVESDNFKIAGMARPATISRCLRRLAADFESGQM